MDPITNLAITISKPGVALDVKLRKTCMCLLQAIQKANRASLWKLDKAHATLECLVCFQSTSSEFSSGQILKRQNFSPYFDQILRGQVLMASDARTHPATSCFTESYFTPLDIYSLLDFVYQKELAPFGVICCESIGEQVEWEDSDVKALRRISRMASLFFDIE